MIQEINTSISHNINNDIINTLFDSKNWLFGTDTPRNKNINKKDSGMVLNSIEARHDILNTYAKVIFYTVEKNSFMKFKKIERIFWNWYHPGSEMKFHDDTPEDNKFSIIYNLHNNNGGTEFRVNNEIKFIKSEESKAILFPSKIYHRGIAPKENLHRFCLNIVVEI